ncbi:hypothetical protein [Mycoplasmoides pneumoniae]|uniref:hypothetical protein n=1 Tax=Mycoplasmoides pneumoniae TaxID=2104 RepID=UPI001F4DA03A|nr:hypothetical protein [Mycoplasmoides pneumoniae]
MRYLDLNIKSILADWEIADAIRELIANAIWWTPLKQHRFPRNWIAKRLSKLFFSD